MKIDRQAILDKMLSSCAYCGDFIDGIKNMQVDHIIPKSYFEYFIKNKHKVPTFLQHLTETDVDHSDNLFPSCRVCNKWKATHTVEQFRIELQEQLKRLNDYSSNYRMAKKYKQLWESPVKITFFFEQINYQQPKSKTTTP